ncbi:unnamed protein product [Ixodes hexagonus]
MCEREVSDLSPEKSPGAERLLIESHSVAFPYAPYTSQKLVIVRVLQGLKNGRNCLIESPTGSGKTLALLCSCLAWQAKQKEIYYAQLEKIQRELEARQNEMQGGCTPRHPSTPARMVRTTAGTPKKNSAVTAAPAASSPLPSTQGSIPNPWLETGQSIVVNGQLVPVVTQAYLDSLLACQEKAKTPGVAVQGSTPGGRKTSGAAKAITIDDDDDDFQPAKKPRHAVVKVAVRACDIKTTDVSLLMSKAPVGTPVKEATEKQPVCSTTGANAQTPAKGIDEKAFDEKPLKKVPVIYYGTRTHKQITQVVRELKKTEYRNARMCILSSRERTCIHPRISNSSNKNEECKELIDDGGCRFHTNLKRGQEYPTLYESMDVEPYDLEDLVRIGSRACPYYWSLDMVSSSDIVFCPYNYLIDPVIRKCLSINLDNAVMVLDEAHNIEDISREVMSISITQDQIRDIIMDLEDMSNPASTLPDHYPMLGPISKTSDYRFVNIPSDSIFVSKSDHTRKLRNICRSLEVTSCHKQLTVVLPTSLVVRGYQIGEKTVTFVTSIEKDPEKYQPMLLASTSAVLQNLTIILDFFYRSNMKYIGDFRAAVVKTASKKRRSDMSGGWHTKSSAGGTSWTHTLSFWCLNPAVAMSDIKDKVHSLIVASGTLSPMESFESELDMPFKSQLQAKHVIPPDGVWIGGIACGPSKQKLTANFRTVETYVFQDEIGSILLDICKTVPFGVLCFFTSYGMMNKLVQRWRNTGMWDNISEHKCIFVEPQKADAGSFDASMIDYCRYATREAEDAQGTGALLLAVCRGKVSEGMDFADNTARAVVTIGIPFPNVKDIQVDQKRKYNDQCSKSGRPVMCGNYWYETQAFRALNQALGRCIRHSSDWGALIVVDHRFSENSRYQKALSKWIRDKFRCFMRYEEAMSSLKAFMDSKMSTADGQCVSGAVMSLERRPHLEAMMTAGTSGGYSSTGVVNCDHSLTSTGDVSMSTETTSVIELTDSSQETSMIVEADLPSSTTVEMSTVPESTVGTMDRGEPSTCVTSLDVSTADCASDDDTIIDSQSSANMEEETVDSLSTMKVNVRGSHSSVEEKLGEASNLSAMSVATPAASLFGEDTVLVPPASANLEGSVDSLSTMEMIACENLCNDEGSKCGDISSMSVMSVGAPAPSCIFDEDTIILSSPLHSVNSPELF